MKHKTVDIRRYYLLISLFLFRSHVLLFLNKWMCLACTKPWRNKIKQLTNTSLAKKNRNFWYIFCKSQGTLKPQLKKSSHFPVFIEKLRCLQNNADLSHRMAYFHILLFPIMCYKHCILFESACSPSCGLKLFSLIYVCFFCLWDSWHRKKHKQKRWFI